MSCPKCEDKAVFLPEKNKLMSPIFNTAAPNPRSLLGGKSDNLERLKAAAALRQADPKLAAIIEQVGPCRLTIRKLHDPFNSLARSIIYQQLNGKAAAAIHARVVQTLTEKRKLIPQDVLAASDESLRAAGLSAAKTRALRDLAERTLDGTVPTLARLRRMNDEEIVERLTQVRGIGRWTVEMLLMFRLGRPDVLPTGDYAIRKGIARMDSSERLPTPSEVAARGEMWKPFRTIASWYLWRWLDLP